MNRKWTIVVLVAAVVLVALAFWQRDATPVDVSKGPATPTPGPIFSLKPEEVQELVVLGPLGKTYTLTKAAGGWEVDGVQASDTVSGTVANVAKLAAAQTLAQDLKPEDYGFNTPAVTVTLKTSGGTTVLFRMGDDVVGQESSAYIRLDGTDQPILVVSNFDLKELIRWLDEKPLAPTPTPPVTEAITDTLGITNTFGVTNTLGLTDTLNVTDTLAVPQPIALPATATP